MAMLSPSRRKYLELASKTYHEQLVLANRSGSLPDGARSYFREHLIDPAIASKYQLGYVTAPLPGDERFIGMLSVPYLSFSGVVALKFRSLSDIGSKYAQASGQKGRLYNSNAYFDAGTSIGISEGEIDAVSATEHLGLPTMGVPGAQGWQDSWKIVLRDFTMVFVFADGDAPGKQFAYDVADAVGWRARVVECPDGEDVSSMCATGRTAELLALMTTSNDDQDE
jgi:hypothetical protein